MLVRAALLLPRAVSARIAGLLPDGVPVFPFPPSKNAFIAAARSSCDLLVCSHASLGSKSADTIRQLLAANDDMDVVVLRPGEDATEPASLLAAGCLAVLSEVTDDQSLKDALGSLVERHRERARARAGRLADTGLDLFTSREPAMQRVLDAARRVAPTDTPVLLLGETGVGKERMARGLHAASSRAAGPFVAVNGATLPDALAESELFGHEAGAFTGAERARRGLFELAHGGTLLLDEVGDLPPAVQAKLLRALQEGEIRPIGSERPLRVDVRVVAATNRDLARETAAGRFRADLFYRLNVVALEIPPLRARRADLPELAQRLVERSARRLGGGVPEITRDAMDAMIQHSWPGNVRELEHVLERAVLLCDGHRIVRTDLGIAGEGPRGSSTVDHELLELPWHAARARAIEEFERSYLDHALNTAGGRIGAAARRVGLSERALFAAMKRLGLHKEDYRVSGAT